MTKPAFARHRAAQTLLLEPAHPGGKAFAVAEPGDLSPGDWLFISDADDRRVECLGPLEGVEQNLLLAAHPLRVGRSAGASIWKAASIFRWEQPPLSPPERVFLSGIFAERSVGGKVWSVRLAEAAREDRLIFPALSWNAFQSFQSWISTEARGGLDDIAWIDAERQVARVRLLRCEFDRKPSPPRTITLILHLALLAEEEYA